MKIQSFNIPQADKLESVVKTIIAISKGAKSDIEIIKDIPDLTTDRQGRYYRKAAEILGFIKNYRNNSVLTDKGKKFLKNPTIKNQDFISSVLNIAIIQRLVPFIELNKKGLTREQIQSYLISIVNENIGKSMIPRRLSTIISWLETLDVVEEKNAYFFIKNKFTSNLPVFDIKDINQPILPETGNLIEYKIVHERFSKAKDIISIYKDQAKLDKANNTHIHLVNLVAKRLSIKGAIPKSNQVIDLAVTLDKDYIFEIKSVNDNNIKGQIRKGLSQLYEYRYLQNKQKAKLVLVIEKPLNSDVLWMLDYMENDRNIYLIWDGDDNLFGTDKAKRDLDFLELM